MKKNQLFLMIIAFFLCNISVAARIVVQDSIYWGELYPAHDHYEFVNLANNTDQKVHIIDLTVIPPTILDSVANKFFIRNNIGIQHYRIMEPSTEFNHGIRMSITGFLEGYSHEEQLHLAKYLFKYKYENDDNIYTDTLIVTFREKAYKNTLYRGISTIDRTNFCGTSTDYTRMQYTIYNYSYDTYLIDTVICKNLDGSISEFSFSYNEERKELFHGDGLPIFGDNRKDPLVSTDNYLVNKIEVTVHLTEKSEKKPLVFSDTITVYRFQHDGLMLDRINSFTGDNRSTHDTIRIIGYPCAGNNVVIEDIRLIGDWKEGEYQPLFDGMLPLDLSNKNYQEKYQMNYPIFTVNKPEFGTYEGVVEIKYSINSNPSNYRYIYVTSTNSFTSVREPEKIENIHIFPNPTNSIINFSENFQNAEYKIIDNLGRVINQGIVTSNSINVSHLENGIYSIIIYDGIKHSSNRFIVIK